MLVDLTRAQEEEDERGVHAHVSTHGYPGMQVACAHCTAHHTTRTTPHNTTQDPRGQQAMAGVALLRRRASLRLSARAGGVWGR